MTLYKGKGEIEEKSYFKKLITAARSMGLYAFVFTPADVSSNNRRIRAHTYEAVTRQWKRQWLPFPTIIFDRCRYQSGIRFKQFKRFRAKFPYLTYINRPLTNKWIMHTMLLSNEHIRPHLPRTVKYSRYSDVFQQLQNHSVIFLKPINGTGGRAILKVERLRDGVYQAQGRNAKRKIISVVRGSKMKVVELIKTWQVHKPLLVQQGVNLTLAQGRVHDFRLLMQKDGSGNWVVAGCAGRIGGKRSVTSNLHGGGKAVSMQAILKQRFQNNARVSAVEYAMEQLGFNVAQFIEKKFIQVCEIALDIGVDHKGKPWLLEINSKPSREIFKQIGQRDVYEAAIRRPLEYALWLYQQEKGVSS